MTLTIGTRIFIILLVVVGVLVLGFFIYKKLNPESIKYDSTVCFTGGIGSGKSLSSVKIAIKEYKRVHRSWRFNRWLGTTIFKNSRHPEKYIYEEPWLISNIPIRWGMPWHYHYSYQLEEDHLTFKKRIPEGSVVFIDEISCFVSQNDWKNPVVIEELSEFIRFFRHYINGIFITNSQSIDEIEVDFRRKLNCYYNCFDFQPLLFGLMYRVRIMRNRVGDSSVSLTADYLDDHARWHYGFLPVGLLKWNRHYDSRCYRHRYDKVKKRNPVFEYCEMATNEILRLKNKGKSVLDDEVK